MREDMQEIVDVQVAASILANGRNKTSFRRRVLAVLPEVHVEAKRAYKMARKRYSLVEGVDEAHARRLAKQSALKRVESKLNIIFRRYDTRGERASLPANICRTNRLLRRNEIRNASHHICISGGPSASENIHLRNVLVKMDDGVSCGILEQCTNPERSGETLQLLLTVSREQSEHRPMYTYRLFSRRGVGVGNAAGAPTETTYASGRAAGSL